MAWTNTNPDTGIYFTASAINLAIDGVLTNKITIEDLDEIKNKKILNMMKDHIDTLKEELRDGVD